MALKDLLRDVKRKARTTIVGAINRRITLRETLPDFRRTDVWHPSELVYQFCPRQVVLQRRHKVEHPEHEVNLELQRIFDIGHAVHRIYQEEYLGPAGLLWGTWRCTRCHHKVEGTMPRESCLCQTGSPKAGGGLFPYLRPSACDRFCGTVPEGSKLTPMLDEDKQAERGGCVHCARWGRWEYLETKVYIAEQNIGGSTDGQLVAVPWSTLPPDTVLEIKSANNRSFGARKVLGPSLPNKKQITLYMHALGLKRGVIVYVSKNDGEIAEFEIEYDRSVIEEELGNAELLERALADDDEPIPPRYEACKSMRSPRAKGCPVADICFGSFA